MKFVCRRCEAFMGFQKVEETGGIGLGITFHCPQCQATFSMVTNPGETQMVQALGVTLGGRETQPAAFELTQSMLKTGVRGEGLGVSKNPQAQDEKSVKDTLKESMGKCPFANTVADMTAKADAVQQKSGGQEILWTDGALRRLENVPLPVRSFAKQMIETMAREQGKPKVDEILMDEAKTRFM